MAEKFRMIVARGIGNRWSVLSVGGESTDTDYGDALEDMNSLLDQCDLDIAIAQGNNILPHDIGVYLFHCEFYNDQVEKFNRDDYIDIKLKSVIPLLTMDVPLYKSGYMRVSLNPSETPILTAKEIIERAKNVPAEDVAEAMLEHTTPGGMKYISGGSIPLMDPPPNEYPNKADGNWVTNDADDPVAQCMSCEFHEVDLQSERCSNPDDPIIDGKISIPCPGHKPADNPGFVIDDRHLLNTKVKVKT